MQIQKDVAAYIKHTKSDRQGSNDAYAVLAQVQGHHSYKGLCQPTRVRQLAAVKVERVSAKTQNLTVNIDVLTIFSNL